MNFLVGDLGGTKTILAICSFDGYFLIKYKKYYASKQWQTFDKLVKDFLNSLPNDIKYPEYGCIAVAGPVFKSEAKITNLGWSINENLLCRSLGLQKCELINDFAVLIYGIPFFEANQYEVIQTSDNMANNFEKVAVIGAGTGLGMAKGVLHSSELNAFASEGGHVEFAPRNKNEWDISQWLKKELNLQRLSLEKIVSGTGLGHIAKWRLKQADISDHPLADYAESWTEKSQLDFPHLVAEAANKGDQVMKDALRIWLSAYGSACGDFALQELCYSGLWISGGTAEKQLQGLRSKNFLDSFANKGRFSDFLKNIPIRALTDPHAGLFSAACRVRTLAELNEKLI